jgi:methylmalonyl-CoA/ethylmalonyl-CoA epimerase
VAERVALERIGQIAITVQDIERAVPSYRDVLGLTLLFQAPPGLAFFDCGGVRLMLSSVEGTGDARVGTSVLYYAVGDIGAAHRVLVGRGVTFVQEPHVVVRMPDHDLWMAFFHDSGGNMLALMHEARR